uniref:ABC transporter substrate-binding protein n=1 Tax=Desertifilum tharense IPPAS B-1220 TaxID=1781255 RepID=A0ACD5H2P0_9CYAN
MDGGQWSMPLPYLLYDGLGSANNRRIHLYVLAKLNTQGQAIAVSNLHKAQNLALNLNNAAEYIKTFSLTQGRRFRVASALANISPSLWLRYWLVRRRDRSRHRCGMGERSHCGSYPRLE